MQIIIYYALPGGAQESNETLDQALNRECIEELGVDITQSKLLCIREYISRNHEYSFIMKEVHSIDFIYKCTIHPNISELISIQADIGQIGIEWLPINKIRESLVQANESLRLLKFPKTLHDFYKEYFLNQIVETYTSKIFED